MRRQLKHQEAVNQARQAAACTVVSGNEWAQRKGDESWGLSKDIGSLGVAGVRSERWRSLR